MPRPISPFKNPAGEAAFLQAYDNVFNRWPVPYEAVGIPTRFGRTHVNVSGVPGAPPLILLPGNFASSADWFSIIPGLVRTNLVYAVDVIGDAGKSIPQRLPANRADYADWLDELRKGLGIEKTDLLGMSYGGFLAVNYALQFPEHLHRLVLLCPGLPLAPFTIHWMIRGMPMMLFASRGTVEWFLAGASVKGFIRGDPVQEAFIAGATALRSRSMMRPVIGDTEWNRLQTPVLLLVGEQEILYDAQTALGQAKKRMPNVKTELVTNAGHLLHSDQPDQINKSVLEFLGSTG
ncbi:MAG: alpha/beta hydrolase [Anaerolineales bacterium]|nr:alpha/beta hydrolase [Anaerolineales bacterium]